MYDPPRARRRLWPILVPLVLVIALAVAWTGFWFYAASRAEAAIEGWRAREAKSGRSYECGSQTISGYPFRIEVRCDHPDVRLRSQRTQLDVKAAGILLLAQVHQPTVLLGEFIGPMTVADGGQPPALVANWTQARSRLRGTPRNPRGGELAFDNLTVRRADRADQAVLTARRIALETRITEGSAQSNPVVEAVLRATAATAPELHAAAAAPLDAQLTATLRGLADFAPMPWPERLRALQARGGRIEITHARVQQGESIAVAAGTLSLTADGNLDGELEATVVGLEQLLKQFDLEAILSKGRVGAAIDKLDRLIPGLGGIARKHAAPSIAIGLDTIGKRTTLDNKPALTVPLRFDRGQVMLGPIPIGRIQPLF